MRSHSRADAGSHGSDIRQFRQSVNPSITLVVVPVEAPLAFVRPPRAEARVAQGARAGVAELPAAQGIDARARASHRVRGGALPQHRRMLAPRHGDVHDSRRRLHARLRVLRRVARTSSELDPAEPARVADAIGAMALQHAVITSVDRDDLPDGGAMIFAETIRETRARVPELSHRSADPGLSGQRIVAPHGARRGTRRAEPQHRDRATAVSHGAFGRTLSSLAGVARSGRAATSRRSRRRPASWSAWAKRSMRWCRCWTTSGAWECQS